MHLALADATIFILLITKVKGSNFYSFGHVEQWTTSTINQTIRCSSTQTLKAYFHITYIKKQNEEIKKQL